MAPVVSFVGKSEIGKTTFLEKVVRELKQRGYRLAVVKHDTHGFDIDKPGKDTWRFAQAGSDVVVISSPRKMALIEQISTERTLDEIAEEIGSRVDIILTEGYKRGNKPKIEVSRAARSTELICGPEELLGVVTDQSFPIDVPHFGLDDAAAVVDLLVEKVIAPSQEAEIELIVDGQTVPLKPFAAAMLKSVLEGLVAPLKGVTEPRAISVSARYAREDK
jgi:molybdopterin-guanine dinucleotide biosynthesis adapter protein